MPAALARATLALTAATQSPGRTVSGGAVELYAFSLSATARPPTGEDVGPHTHEPASAPR